MDVIRFNVQVVAVVLIKHCVVGVAATAGSNSWHGTIPCAYSATMEIEYDLTENGTTQHFNVPVGGIVLIEYLDNTVKGRHIDVDTSTGV